MRHDQRGKFLYENNNWYLVTDKYTTNKQGKQVYEGQDKKVVSRDYVIKQQGYSALSGYDDTVPTNYSEMVTVSGRPEFTNIFYTSTGDNVEMRNEVPILSTIDNSFLLFGLALNSSLIRSRFSSIWLIVLDSIPMILFS